MPKKLKTTELLAHLERMEKSAAFFMDEVAAVRQLIAEAVEKETHPTAESLTKK